MHSVIKQAISLNQDSFLMRYYFAWWALLLMFVWKRTVSFVELMYSLPYLMRVIIWLKVRVLVYYASIVHTVMTLKFTVLMRAVYRYFPLMLCWDTNSFVAFVLDWIIEYLQSWTLIFWQSWPVYSTQCFWADVSSCICQRPPWPWRPVDSNPGMPPFSLRYFWQLVDVERLLLTCSAFKGFSC